LHRLPAQTRYWSCLGAVPLYRRTGDERFQGVVLGNLSEDFAQTGQLGRAFRYSELIGNCAQAGTVGHAPSRDMSNCSGSMIRVSNNRYFGNFTSRR
jgi:hypothetical protein